MVGRIGTDWFCISRLMNTRSWFTFDEEEESTNREVTEVNNNQTQAKPEERTCLLTDSLDAIPSLTA